MDWWVHDMVRAGLYVELVSWIFWVLFSITLHELAHGWAAIHQGDDTPVRQQRMTLNPIVHMGYWSLIIFALIGIAWGLMPVDPSRFREGRVGRMKVAAAGPMMNIVLAVVTLTLAALWGVYGPAANAGLHDKVLTFLFVGGWLNLLLAGFNLLPLPPLDGANILAGYSLKFYQLMQHPNAPMFAMFALVVLFFSGIGGLLFGGAQLVSELYVGWLAGLLGGAAGP